MKSSELTHQFCRQFLFGSYKNHGGKRSGYSACFRVNHCASSKASHISVTASITTARVSYSLAVGDLGDLRHRWLLYSFSLILSHLSYGQRAKLSRTWRQTLHSRAEFVRVYFNYVCLCVCERCTHCGILSVSIQRLCPVLSARFCFVNLWHSRRKDREKEIKENREKEIKKKMSPSLSAALTGRLMEYKTLKLLISLGFTERKKVRKDSCLLALFVWDNLTDS